jgi:hypothetical protein
VSRLLAYRLLEHELAHRAAPPASPGCYSHHIIKMILALLFPLCSKRCEQCAEPAQQAEYPPLLNRMQVLLRCLSLFV